MMPTCEHCEAAVETTIRGACPECGSSAGKLAFIADEKRPFRDFLVSELGNLGYQVEVFSDGDGLLERIRKERPGLLLANVYLKGMLGVELCEGIKAEPALDTKVLLIGAIFRADRFRSKPESSYGADGYLEEGLTAESFGAIVRKAAGQTAAGAGGEGPRRR